MRLSSIEAVSTGLVVLAIVSCAGLFSPMYALGNQQWPRTYDAFVTSAFLSSTVLGWLVSGVAYSSQQTRTRLVIALVALIPLLGIFLRLFTSGGI